MFSQQSTSFEDSVALSQKIVYMYWRLISKIFDFAELKKDMKKIIP